MTQMVDTSINSDKDYLKIYQDGQILLNASSAPDADSTYPFDPSGPALTGFASIPHPLGVVPLVRAYWQWGGRWYNAVSYTGGLPSDPRLKIIATTSYVKLIVATDGSAKNNIPVFYRIYKFDTVGLTSDDRIDKVFATPSASGTVAGAAFSDTPNQNTLVLPHTAGESPLFTVEFSEDLVNWYSEGSQIVGPFDTSSGPPGGPYAYYYYTSAFGSCDSSNMYVTLESNYPTNKVIYVRYALDYRL